MNESKVTQTSPTWSFYKGDKVIAEVRDDAFVAEFVRTWLTSRQPKSELADMTVSVDKGEKMPISNSLVARRRTRF